MTDKLRYCSSGKWVGLRQSNSVDSKTFEWESWQNVLENSPRGQTRPRTGEIILEEPFNTEKK